VQSISLRMLLKHTDVPTAFVHDLFESSHVILHAALLGLRFSKPSFQYQQLVTELLLLGAGVLKTELFVAEPGCESELFGLCLGTELVYGLQTLSQLAQAAARRR
jgi:hypothetical protein